MIERSQEEPLIQESTEEQQLPQESATQEEQLLQESTLFKHDREGNTERSDQSIFLGLLDIVDLQEFELDWNDSFSSVNPISPKWAMAANNPFCVDSSCEGIANQSDGSGTFCDMYTFLQRSYGSKWPTPSDIPTLPEPEIGWYNLFPGNRYGPNLPSSLFDTPILLEMELDAINLLLVDYDDPNRGKRLKDAEEEKPYDEFEATDDAKSPQNYPYKATAEIPTNNNMILQLVASLQELYKDRFMIQKILSKTDVSRKGNSLLLPKDSVMDYIFPYLIRADQKVLIESSEGLKFNVYDEVEELTFEMRLKKYRGRNSYIFIDHWTDNFVQRRGLKEGDTVCFSWGKSYNSIPCLRFTVLNNPRLTSIISLSLLY